MDLRDSLWDLMGTNASGGSVDLSLQGDPDLANLWLFGFQRSRRAFSSMERLWVLRNCWRCSMLTYNKPLVPTRTGEAPLLAAQRRR